MLEDNNARMRVREESYADEVMSSPQWIEDMQRLYRIPPDMLRAKCDEFMLDCRCYGHTHDNADDFKRHFNNWLRGRRDRDLKKQKDADNTKGHEDRRRGYEIAASDEKDYCSTF